MSIDANVKNLALEAFDTAERARVAFSQQATRHKSTGSETLISFPAGGRGFNSHPGLWFLDTVFLIPKPGPYLASVSFVKNPYTSTEDPEAGGTNDDVYAELWCQSGNSNRMLFRAWSGVTDQRVRSSASCTMIVKLERGDELGLKANSDKGRERDMREITLTFHDLS
jgi:hypothetical protein